MRIALTIHALHGGGAERVLARLADRWSAAGHELHVITWSAASTDEIALSSSVRRHGLGLTRDSTNLWQAIRANLHRVRALRQKLRELRPELILSFCDQMNISTLQASRGLDLPVWIAERSDPARQRLGPLWEWWRRRTYPSCTGCIAQTDEIAQHLSQWISPSRIKVIPNAVDPVASPEAPQSSSTCPPITSVVASTASTNDASPDGDTANGESPKTVLSVGRLSREKGIDQLLQAWQQAHAQMPQWELQIVGDGPQRASLEAQAANLPRVHFTGWLAEPAQIYRTAQMFVLPSRYEGFPNALLEAMSYGLACLSTDCSQAIAELSRDGQALYVASGPAESLPQQLASGLIELAANSQRRQQLGAAARRVSLDYSWGHIGPLWDKLLSSEFEIGPGVQR